MLHGRVTAAHRPTAVPAMSPAMALADVLGNLTCPGVVADQAPVGY